MRDEVARPLGIILAFTCALWSLAVVFELLLARSALASPGVSWQGSFDSGEMAFSSVLVALSMVPPVLAGAIVLVTLAFRAVRLTVVGWVAVVVFAILLIGAWTGPATPSSWPDYLRLLSIWLGGAAAGVVTGVNLRSARSRPEGRVEPGPSDAVE
ncbi:hypothetical protein [Propionicimonas sp.]|uniref:hypothetical protein n=1 Tax=Propionicimonas sp. TaxID=1955623 RepID=UPI00184CD419|nr:hypothetical protein [Propionicimonas sp.]MBU3977926.1 hypothetical protein [Actinomycetota bacterium]MBA3021851.1 hypothetical protein [Propionicimonas sp.]MBU3985370.1 hypothetical protein [Actinomycetota bacterium]MBU4007425.1 hypothetical protein [Actinomycetota bacterium]MBU4065629.1 hypothetical protein [Actinomycetota bacterium]